MNRIEKLIKEKCPDGVKRLNLENCTTIIRGRRVTKKDLIPDGKYPVVSGGTSPMGFINEYNREENTITISQYGTAGYVDFQNQKFWANDVCYSIYPNEMITNRYLWYALKNKQEYLYSIRNTDAVPYSLPLDVLKTVEIPLPPLPIQQEIVKILDSFTALQQNLEDELKLRQKQYEHYREKLLTFEEGEVEWKKLGDIGKMTRGTGLMKSDFTEEGYPCIHYGQVHTYYGTTTYNTKSFCSNELAKKLKKAKTGNLIIATTSEDVEACCKAVVWLGDGEVAYSGDSFCFAHNQNPKYIAYLFQTEQFARQKRMVATGAKVVRVSGEAMEKFIFPFPSLEKQNKIVQTLDHFESLISNLKTEIELRKKQYEYYREKLLTFE